jgi:hypothetical protein
MSDFDASGPGPIDLDQPACLPPQPVPWSPAPDEPALAWSPAPDEPGVLWTPAPDEPANPWSSFEDHDGAQSQWEPDGAHEDAWIAAEVRELQGRQRLSPVTVDMLYDGGASLFSLRAIAFGLQPSAEERDGGVYNAAPAAQFGGQLDALVDGLREGWRTSAGSLSLDELAAECSRLSASDTESDPVETFADLQREIFVGELAHRTQATMEAWVDGVPPEVVEARIAGLRATATTAGDPGLLAAAAAAERVLYGRVLFRTLAELGDATLIDLRAHRRSVDHDGAGVVARARLEALDRLEAGLLRDPGSEVVIGADGRVETRAEQGRRLLALAFERESAANKDLVGALVFHFTRNPDLAVALSGLSNVAVSTAHARMTRGPLTPAPEVPYEPDAPGSAKDGRGPRAPFDHSRWTIEEAQRIRAELGNFVDGPAAAAAYAERFTVTNEPVRPSETDHLHGGGFAWRTPADRSAFGVRFGHGRDPGIYFMRLFEGPSARADAVAFAKVQAPALAADPTLRARLGVTEGWRDGRSDWTHCQVVEIPPVEGRGAAVWNGVAGPQHDWAKGPGGESRPDHLAVGGRRQVLVDPDHKKHLRVVDAFKLPKR